MGSDRKTHVFRYTDRFCLCSLTLAATGFELTGIVAFTLLPRGSRFFRSEIVAQVCVMGM